MPRRRLHRYVFLLAGIYNLSWGLISAIYPQWFFRLVDLPDLNHPAIYSCLGMVVGIYGLLYWDVARVPERGWTIAAVGLLGKILGPIGMVVLIWDGTWPSTAFILCVTNDVVWWPFFLLYLRDSWAYRPTLKG